MTEILNYPAYLLDRHTNWHMHPGHPELGGRAIPPPNIGSGREFLDFHHQFLIDFHLWYDVQPGADQALVAAWTSIPPEMKAADWFGVDINSFEAQVNNTSAFATEDDLGRFIEPVHNTGHGIMANVYGDALVGPIMTSPRSSHFYNWHGLIDHWRNKWLQAHKVVEIVPKAIKDTIDTKFVEVFPKAIKDTTDTLKVIEVGHFPGPGPDPAGLIQQLARRVSDLEIRLATGQAFIRPEERPDLEQNVSEEGT